MIVWLNIIFPQIISMFRGIEDIYKLVILFLTLFPLGFFMGMAYPQGLAQLETDNLNKKIPIAWTVNGILSVTGSVLAITLSMTLGFTTTMILGGLAYLSIFIFPLLRYS